MVAIGIIAVLMTGWVLLPRGSSPDLVVDPDNIIVDWQYNGQMLGIRGFACNRTDDDWKGTVSVEIYNTDNELIYTSPAAI